MSCTGKIDDKTEAAILKLMQYAEESEEPIRDAAICKRYGVHKQVLTRLRKKYNMPSRAGGRVI